MPKTSSDFQPRDNGWKVFWLRLIGALLLVGAVAVPVLIAPKRLPLCEANRLPVSELSAGADYHIENAELLEEYARLTRHGSVIAWEWALSFDSGDGERVIVSLSNPVDSRNRVVPGIIQAGRKTWKEPATRRRISAGPIAVYASSEPLDGGSLAKLTAWARQARGLGAHHVLPIQLTLRGETEAEYGDYTRAEFLKLCAAVLLFVLAGVGVFLYSRTLTDEERENES